MFLVIEIYNVKCLLTVSMATLYLVLSSNDIVLVYNDSFQIDQVMHH